MAYKWKAVEFANVPAELTWELCPNMPQGEEDILLCYWGRVLIGEVACDEPYLASFGSDEPINMLLKGKGFASIEQAKGAVELEFHKQLRAYLTYPRPEAAD